jgi:hypothetical protein
MGSRTTTLSATREGGPTQKLKQTWDADRSALVSQLRKLHDKIVLDWGFPAPCLPWVEELRKCGVKLIWFAGDIDRAREIFVQRGGIAVEKFDNQVADIRTANFPASLNCVIIARLSSTGIFVEDPQVTRMIFG